MSQLHKPPSGSLHFPRPAHSFVELTDCIHSLTCCGVVSDITAAEFLRPAQADLSPSERIEASVSEQAGHK